MACAARALFDDQPFPSRPRAGAVHLLARAANDNAPLANLIATTNPLTHTSSQTFDPDRRVLLAIARDPGACATGGTTNLATRSWDIQPRTFTYDPAGRLTGANIPNFGLSYSYDAAGRPTNLSNARTAGYGWDDAGNLQTLTYPDATTVVTYQYDALNRTTKALIGGQSDGALSYDALGRRQTLTFRDSSTQTWRYDNADRVTSIAHVFPGDTGNNVTFTYGYDPVGREMSKSVDNAAYDYVPPAANVTYAAANALNQYPSVDGYAYSYWPEGGLKETDTLAANYDELGTMIEGFTTLTPGVIDPGYSEYVGVDALGHKYFHEAQTVAGQPYPFVYHSTDGLRPETILEWVYQGLNGAPQTLQGTRRYVLGPDPDERWAYIGPNGGTYNPHTDREGTLIALSNGGLVSRIYTWDAYGQNTSPADETSTGPAGYLYRYTGQRFDPATSLYDYKARDYSPVLGRFLQPDPAGLDQGPNLYEYVEDEPVGDNDPTGMAVQDFWDISAKINRAYAIGVEQLTRFGTHNDEGDALRHATWTYRMTKEMGSFWATAFSTMHELQDTAHGQPLSELRMDMHNNTVGIASAEEDRPINPTHLVTIPMSHGQYEDFSAGKISGDGSAINASAAISHVARTKGYDSVRINRNGTITGTATKTGSRIPTKTTCDSKGHCTTS